MKLYSSIGPNPRVVRQFAAEKGLQLETVEVDILAGANRQPDYLAKNSTGQTPCLQLQGGRVICEITAICEYLEELHPAPTLIGDSAEQRAETRMWLRRIDQRIIEPEVLAFRSAEGFELFKDRYQLLPGAVSDLRAISSTNLQWLERQLAGRRWICGERFSLADILLFAFVDFLAPFRQAIEPAQQTLSDWYQRMLQRPSSAASLHPTERHAA